MGNIDFSSTIREILIQGEDSWELQRRLGYGPVRLARPMIKVKNPMDEDIPAYQFKTIEGRVVTRYMAGQKKLEYFCKECGKFVEERRYLCFQCMSTKWQNSVHICECGYPMETNELCPICNPQ